MGLTLKAMKRVSEVKHKRQDLFYRNRMKVHKGMQVEQIRANIRNGIEILAPAASDREKVISKVLSKVSVGDKAIEKQMETE